MTKTRPGADCGSDYELLITKPKVKLKSTDKIVKLITYNINNIPYKYAVEVRNRFDALDLEEREPEELWSKIRNIIEDEAKRNIPNKKKSTKAKWLSVDALRIAEERRRNAKGNGDKQEFSRLNGELQKMARRDKDKSMNDQCQEIEDDDRKEKTRDLFKKINQIKSTFYANAGTVKDKQGKDLTEKNYIKKRWSEYTEELYKNDTKTTNGFDDLITELEPDILDSEVKWALQNIGTNKAAGVDGIPIELFSILQDDAVNVLLAVCQQVWKTQQWPKDWRRSIYVSIPQKGNAKECSNYRTIALISHASKAMLKILQARMEQYMTRELSDVQAGFKRGRGARDLIANIRWIIETAR